MAWEHGHRGHRERSRDSPGQRLLLFQDQDEIGSAIVNLRLARFRKLLQEFEKAADPKERLCAFVQTKIKDRETRATERLALFSGGRGRARGTTA
jgi:hypothetical protein